MLSIRHILINAIFLSLGNILAKFGLAAVISPVLVVDKVKSGDDFDFALALTFLRFFKTFLRLNIESFRLPHRPPRYSHSFAS